jgi:uncharacterized protein YqeY
MSTLKDRIVEDMKAAMRAKEADRLSTIRMLLAAIKQREVDERIELDDNAVVAIAVLQAYLPQRLSAEAVDSAVLALVARLGAAGPGDMGRVMAAAKAELGGQAEMALVSAAVKKALAR